MSNTKTQKERGVVTFTIPSESVESAMENQTFSSNVNDSFDIFNNLDPLKKSTIQQQLKEIHSQPSLLDRFSHSNKNPVSTQAPILPIQSQESDVAPLVEQIQIIEKPQAPTLQIHIGCLFILFNPIFTGIYRPVLRAIAKLETDRNDISPYLTFIDKKILVRRLCTFGTFSIDRCDEFKTMLIEVITKSEINEPSNHKSKSHTNIKTILSEFIKGKQNEDSEVEDEEIDVADGAPEKEILDDPRFVSLMKFVCNSIVDKHFIKMFEDSALLLCMGCKQALEGSVSRDDLPTFFDFFCHKRTSGPFSKFIARRIKFESPEKSEWTKHYREDVSRMYNNLSQCIPMCIALIPSPSSTKKQLYFDDVKFADLSRRWGPF